MDVEWRFAPLGAGRTRVTIVHRLQFAFLGGNILTEEFAEIAFAAGFRDISHFNRLFKRSNGAAPREFRRAMTLQV